MLGRQQVMLDLEEEMTDDDDEDEIETLMSLISNVCMEIAPLHQ